MHMVIFYQYHNINQIKLVVKKGLHPEVKSDGVVYLDSPTSHWEQLWDVGVKYHED